MDREELKDAIEDGAREVKEARKVLARRLGTLEILLKEAGVDIGEPEVLRPRKTEPEAIHSPSHGA